MKNKYGYKRTGISVIITITVYYLARCVSRDLLCEAVSTLPEAPLGICDALKFALQIGLRFFIHQIN